jgi:methionyl-tRNA formyltransferase
LSAPAAGTLRVVFAGTPEFAAAALAAIDAAGFPVALVLTQPDRPTGRGMKLAAGPVKQYALAHGLPVAQPPSLRRAGKYPGEAAKALALLRATPHDVMVVAAYGLLLPQEVLDIPPRGCINIHASLLPRWRGAAPIHRAIEAGDTQTGITLMQMDAGLDTGAMLAVERVPVSPQDTTATLHDRLAALGARMIVEELGRIATGRGSPPVAQPEAGACYAPKVAKDEAILDWRRDAAALARRVRAFDPFPGAVATLDGTPLKIWAAAPAEGHGEPGEVLAVTPAGVTVACGEGALLLTQLQKPGGKRLAVREFLAGFALHAGQRFSV